MAGISFMVNQLLTPPKRYKSTKPRENKPRLTAAQVEKIYELLALGVPVTRIAERFDRSSWVISKHKKKWLEGMVQ